MNSPIFITGNLAKVDYLTQVLGIQLEHRKLSLDEIQSADPRAVAEHKARQAYDIFKQPVLVEDSYLSFNALGGLPGPFVKFFYETPGSLEMMCRMFDGFQDRTISVGAVYCYYDGVQSRCFDGRVEGVAASHPRGKNGFGWDRIVEPSGYEGATLAELPLKESVLLYNNLDGFKRLRDYLFNREHV